jgi:hypothetical protein
MRINFTFLFFLVSFATAKEADWPSQEIYSGSHVNSAIAHDYNGDGKQEILFLCRREVLHVFWSGV